MAANESIAWKRVGVEATAIVLSILLAFAIDAWWENRQERQFEQEMLLGLQNEYQGHREVLVYHNELYVLFLSSIASLMDACESGAWTSTEISVDFAIANIVSPTTTDLGAGVLQSLISAGKLEVLGDKQLRYELAEWQSVLDELSDDQANTTNQIRSLVIPFLTREGIPFGELHRWGSTPVPSSVRSLAGDDAIMQRLFSNAEFRSILETRFAFMSHAVDEFDDVIVATDSILEKIAASLEN
jgi:hypothetical protein